MSPKINIFNKRIIALAMAVFGKSHGNLDQKLTESFSIDDIDGFVR